MERIASSREIQERLLDMAKEIAFVLEKHNIPYTMAYGTLLGAVRHKGFIPWDEDIDFFLFSDSFEEAKDYLRRELPEKYFLEDIKSEPKFFHAWAHVKDLNSIAIHDVYAHDDAYSHKGLSVDLYLLTRVKLRDLWTFLNGENRRYINRRKELGLMTEEDYNARLEKIKEAEQNAIENVIDSDEEVYANITPHKYKYIPMEVLFPLKKYQFENTEFYGMNDADTYLTNIYGDYMVPPPENKRNGGHLFVKFLD